MRAWKLTRPLTGVLALVGVLALSQPLSIYYRSSAFDDYLKHEIWRTRAVERLKGALLDKAKDYALPVNEDDIRITEAGAVFRVDVDYRVPLNLLIYKPQLKFHSVSAGLIRE
jgi:hypothetical protein